jgi:predicted RNase H-like HicB family nuclease
MKIDVFRDKCIFRNAESIKTKPDSDWIIAAVKDLPDGFRNGQEALELYLGDKGRDSTKLSAPNQADNNFESDHCKQN